MKKFWHTSNGKVFEGGQEETVKEYKAHIRTAYGSLRGVRVYEALSEDFGPTLLEYLPEQLSEKQRAAFVRR